MSPRSGNPSVTRVGKSIAAVARKEGLGAPLVLFMIWLWFEYGRPTYPLSIPLIISAALLVSWLMNKNKRWSSQSTLLVAFLGAMAAGIPFAANTFSAFWTLYATATILVCLCLPLPSIVTSVRRVRTWIYAFVGVALYVGVWAVFSGGLGPSGAAGGQDENYVAAMMGMAISFAYFSIFAAKSRIGKIVLAASIPIFLAATIAGQNVSRGGFVGLCAVFVYCLARSPRKWIGIVVITLIIAIVLPFAGPNYWDEINSIGDVNEGTADMRIEIWKIGMRMWQANPIFGVGAGNFRWMIGAYQSAEQMDKYGRDLGGSIIAHSLFVELLAELGTVGALVLLLLLRSSFKNLRQVIRSAHPREVGFPASRDAVALRCYADATTGAIIACLVNGAFLSLLYYSYLWLFIALGGAIWQISHSCDSAPRAA